MSTPNPGLRAHDKKLATAITLIRIAARRMRVANAQKREITVHLHRNQAKTMTSTQLLRHVAYLHYRPSPHAQLAQSIISAELVRRGLEMANQQLLTELPPPNEEESFLREISADFYAEGENTLASFSQADNSLGLWALPELATGGDIASLLGQVSAQIAQENYLPLGDNPTRVIAEDSIAEIEDYVDGWNLDAVGEGIALAIMDHARQDAAFERAGVAVDAPVLDQAEVTEMA